MELMDEQESPGADRPLNTITVAGRDLLLVEVGGGTEIHLALEYVDSDRVAIQIAGGLDDATLWEQKTLCGREWHHMAAGADDPTLLWQDAAFAPTCRACLRVLDTWFPKSTAPPGVGLLAEVVADAVAERSSTFVTGVPGEHLETTRRAIRKTLRDRGLISGTRSIDGTLVVWSDDAYHVLDRDGLGTSTAAAIGRIMAGEVSDALAPSPQATIAWSSELHGPPQRAGAKLNSTSPNSRAEQTEDHTSTRPLSGTLSPPCGWYGRRTAHKVPLETPCGCVARFAPAVLERSRHEVIHLGQARSCSNKSDRVVLLVVKPERRDERWTQPDSWHLRHVDV